MLCYKAAQVIACTKIDPKPWTFDGKSGVTHSAKLACLGSTGDVAVVLLKSKTAEELVAKVGKYSIGKPADVPISQVIPIFKAGEKKPSDYELVG